MTKQIDAALGILGIETTFGTLANQDDPAEKLVAASQIAASMFSMIPNVDPLGIAATNAASRAQ